jgi:hypothetical protein
MSEAHVTRTEPEGVAARPVLYVAIGFLIFVAACLGGLFVYYSDVVGKGPSAKPEPFPAPQLQRTPLSDLQKLEQKQQAQLRGYAWVDKKQGIVRIPIERAMQIIAAKGGTAAFGSLDDLNKAPPSPAQKQETAKAAQQTSTPDGVL